MKRIYVNWRLKCGENQRSKLTVFGETGPQTANAKVSAHFSTTYRVESKASKRHDNQPYKQLQKLCVKVADEARIPVMRKCSGVPPYSEHVHIDMSLQLYWSTHCTTVKLVQLQITLTKLCMLYAAWLTCTFNVWHIIVIRKFPQTNWPTQPSIPPGSVNEYQLRLGRQRQVWFIPLADERGVCM